MVFMMLVVYSGVLGMKNLLKRFTFNRPFGNPQLHKMQISEEKFDFL